AGPLMNLLLAFVIFGALFAVNGVPTVVDGAEVVKVFDNTPAARAGFQAGDIMLSVEDQPIRHNLDLIRNAAHNNSGTPIPFFVQRGDQQIRLSITSGPWTAPDRQRNELGFGFQYGANVQHMPASLPTAFMTGFNYTWEILGRFISGLGQMIGGLVGANAPPPGGVAGGEGGARGAWWGGQRAGVDGV